MDLPKRFALFRKDMQMFEIMRPYGPDENPHKIVYEEPLGVPLWHVVRSEEEVLHLTTKINGKDCIYTYTGASLIPAVPNDSIEKIPIVQFLRNGHIPNNIRGVRVLYMDGLNAVYFSKKIAIPKPVKARTIECAPEDDGYVADSDVGTETETCAEMNSDDEFMDQSKGMTMLMMIMIFFFACVYSNYHNKSTVEMNCLGPDCICYDWEAPYKFEEWTAPDRFTIWAP